MQIKDREMIDQDPSELELEQQGQYAPQEQETQLWCDLTAMVARNRSTLLTVRLGENGQRIRPSVAFLQALKSLPRLKAFESRGGHYDSQMAVDLLDAQGSYLIELGLQRDHIRRPELWRQGLDRRLGQAQMFLSLQSLTLQTYGLNPDEQMQLIRLAPHLKSLTWDLGSHPFPGSVFCQHVLPLCQELESIDFHAERQQKNMSSHEETESSQSPCPPSKATESTPTDDTLTQILTQRKRVIKLHIFASGFGPQAMMAIRRHCSMLTTLNFHGCAKFTSAMAQECLSTMPMLKRFSADAVSGQDIIQGMSSGRPWMCRRISMLQVAIVDMPSIQQPHQQQQEEYVGEVGVDYNTIRRWSTDRPTTAEERQLHLSIHSRVLGQLSMLRELVMLFIGYYDYWMQNNSSSLPKVGMLLRQEQLREQYGTQNGVGLSSEAGLRQLDGLDKLRMLSVARTWQQMSIEDVTWMKQKWPNLFWLQGDLHQDPYMKRQVEEHLHRTGVRVAQ
ncbi:hypothetical protein EDD11_005643 [Mortierella claussenii]|nr:hypothetical protein EDD11_005643 [Mortierella claussenii]